MSLRERLVRETQQPAAMLARGAVASGGDEQNGAQSFQEMKSRLHRAIINRMDLTKLAQLEPEQVHAEVARLAEGLLAVENAPTRNRPCASLAAFGYLSFFWMSLTVIRPFRL